MPGFGLSGKPSRFLDVSGLADALAAWMRVSRLPAATLLGKHVQVAGALVTFEFPGKSKKRIAAHMVDRKVARNIASFRKTAGSRLFRLETSNGHRAMTATDLNSYLARIAGCDISAKDFRTLRASTVALERLRRVPVKTPAEKKRILVAVCKEVAGILRNTAAVTRTSYIHSSIISAYQDEALTCREISLGGCNKSERRLLGFLRRENSTKQMSRPARR